jgi:hypothetical protein
VGHSMHQGQATHLLKILPPREALHMLFVRWHEHELGLHAMPMRAKGDRCVRMSARPRPRAARAACERRHDASACAHPRVDAVYANQARKAALDQRHCCRLGGKPACCNVVWLQTRSQRGAPALAAVGALLCALGGHVRHDDGVAHGAPAHIRALAIQMVCDGVCFTALRLQSLVKRLFGLSKHQVQPPMS